MKITLNSFKHYLSVDLILFLLYAITSLVPYFGSVDRAITQWLYLSVINSISIFYLLYNINAYSAYKNLFKSLLFLFFSLFIISIVISFFQTYNIVESIIKLSQWFNLYFSFIVFCFILTKVPRILIFLILSLIFIIQLYFTFHGYFQLIEYVSFDFSMSYLLKGVTGNKNVAATLFCILIPFVYYLLFVSKKTFHFVFLFLILTFAFYAIFLLGSRTSYIILFFQFIAFLFSFLHFSFKSKFNFRNFSLKLIKLFLPILFSLFVFSNFTGNNTSIQIQDRVQSINPTDASTNIRLKFFSLAIDEFLSAPFTGIGAGNWKIKSVELYSSEIENYTAPYHVHNDFLEIAVELGLFGLVPFILIFFSIFYYGSYIIRNSFSFINFFYIYCLFISIGSYIIDSMLNFPHARPAVSLLLMISLSLVSLEYFKIKSNE